MDREDFTESAPGILVTTTIRGTETPAFVPDDLDSISLDQGGLVDEIGQAMRELGALDHLGPVAGSGNMLIEAFARKEAVQSSRIEGTEVTLADVYRYEAKQAVGEDSGDNEGARQAKNYLNALEVGLSALESDRQISRDLLCQMHKILLDGVRSEDPSPGELRTSQNWLAPYEGAQISDASFVPPPPDEAHDNLRSLLEYTNNSRNLHAMLRLGLIHYQFETIHPFRDGNGRLGRLLISLLLQRDELLSRPYLYLSAYFNKHRRDYIRLLTRVRTRGNWEDWLRFVLHGIWQQAHEGVQRGQNLIDLREEYIDRYQAHRSRNILPLAQYLFESPYITARQVEQELDCSHTTAYNLIDTLQEDGVLEQTDGDGQREFYVAAEIFDLLDKPLDQIRKD